MFIIRVLSTCSWLDVQLEKGLRYRVLPEVEVESHLVAISEKD